MKLRISSGIMVAAYMEVIDMFDIINFSKLALKMGYMGRTSFSKNKIPDKLKPAFEELDEFLKCWIEKYKKAGS